jgi:hypothetical protein
MFNGVISGMDAALKSYRNHGPLPAHEIVAACIINYSTASAARPVSDALRQIFGFSEDIFSCSAERLRVVWQNTR